MAVLHIPNDFERWPEYLDCVHRIERSGQPNPPALATGLLMRLWVDLSYELEATGRNGFLRSESLPRFNASCRCGDLNAVATLGEFLKETEGGWICNRFIRCNPHLDPSHVPFHLKGAAASRHTRSVRRFARDEAVVQSLLIPAENWRQSDGTPLSAEQVRRVMILIKAFDNALFRQDRPPTSIGYSETLISDAARALEDYLPDQIDAICKWIVTNRGHPAIPPTTEQALANLRDLASALPED